MTLLLPARIPMRFASLFAGIGGFDLGFERAGMECVAQVEWDEKARSVLEKRFPNARMYKDVRDVGRDDLGSVDLICGGFPCQDVSVAGKRKGLAGERSGLWFEFRRILDEVRPRWVVIENVPGLLSSNDGRDFAAVLHGLVELRYRVGWRVLDAQYFGVAQRRRRVFLVGCLTDGRAAEVLFERESGAWDSPPRREKGQGAAVDAEDRAGTGGTNWDIMRARIHDAGHTAPTLGANEGRGGAAPMVATHDLAPSLTSSGRGVGRTGESRGQDPVVAVAFGGGRQFVESDVSTSLSTKFRSDWETETFIAAPLADSGAGTARTGNERTEAEQLVVVGATETAKTITQNYGKQPDNSDSSTPGNFAIAIQHAAIGRHDGAGPAAKGWRDDGASWTLDSRGEADAVVYGLDGELNAHPNQAGTLTALSRSGGGTPAMVSVPAYAVRRLTPVECERLQGFPDGWTDGQADTTRYKQLGNAVCVNVSAWLGRRIVAADRQP